MCYDYTVNKCTVCKTTETIKWYIGPKCQKCYGKEWYQLNKTSKVQKTRKKQYYQLNKEKIISYKNEYTTQNPKKVKKWKQKWYQLNKHCLKNRTEYLKKYRSQRRKNDIVFKIKENLRTRTRNALTRGTKGGSAVHDLGCSINKLKIKLQLKFHRNSRGKHEYMSWNNYGEWHIDHIRPLSSFDLTDRKQFLIACHYSNLQPMWAKDNLKKSDHVTQYAQSP